MLQTKNSQRVGRIRDREQNMLQYSGLIYYYLIINRDDYILYNISNQESDERYIPNEK